MCLEVEYEAIVTTLSSRSEWLSRAGLNNGGIGPKASLNLGDSRLVMAGQAQVTSSITVRVRPVTADNRCLHKLVLRSAEFYVIK